MKKGNEKFVRRQKEVARQQAQVEKRRKRAERDAERKSGGADDGIAAIQAAIDAGIDPRTLREGDDDGAALEAEDPEPAP